MTLPIKPNFRMHRRPPPLDTSMTTGSPVVHYGSPFGFGYTTPPMIFNGTSLTPSPFGASPTVIPSPVQAYGSPLSYYSDGFSSQMSPSIVVPTARSAFAQSIPAMMIDNSTAYVVPAFSGQPLSPTVLRHPKLQGHAQSTSDSLRRTVLMRQQQNSAAAMNSHSAPSPNFIIGSPSTSSFTSSPTSQSSVSSNDPPPMASCTTITVPSKTPLPPFGDTSRIDHRYEHYYTNLVFVGLEGTTPPFNRIRKWKTIDDTYLYDCVCGKRIPNDSLHKVKRHAYRHAVSSYVCGVCAKEFKAHWSLNAHKRIHKTVEG